MHQVAQAHGRHRARQGHQRNYRERQRHVTPRGAELKTNRAGGFENVFASSFPYLMNRD
jgi:hypothetical protein